MKKSLIALAVLAAAGTASAQSSVTLFGIVDATIQRVNNEQGPSVTRLTNSGYNSSRLGFRGTEDLGGGMSASFWLEAGLTNDDGTGAGTNLNNQAAGTGTSVGARQGLTFNRRSTVSLAGGWGELRLGRDYTPQFWNLTVFDAFGTNGIGTTQTLNSITGATGGINNPAFPTAVRASNSIGYFLPGNLGGFYGQYMHYLGENPSGTNVSNDGTGDGIRVGWANGPFNVALGMSETTNHVGINGVVSANDQKIKQNNIGGSWDFGMAQVLGHYTWDSVGNVDGTGWNIGALFPIGAGQIRVAYSEYKIEPGGGLANPTSKKWALGYVHNLSKRTAVYVTWADVSNSNGAQSSAAPGAAGNPAPGKKSSGFDLGLRHSF